MESDSTKDGFMYYYIGQNLEGSLFFVEVQEGFGYFDEISNAQRR